MRPLALAIALASSLFATAARAQRPPRLLYATDGLWSGLAADRDAVYVSERAGDAHRVVRIDRASGSATTLFERAPFVSALAVDGDDLFVGVSRETRTSGPIGLFRLARTGGAAVKLADVDAGALAATKRYVYFCGDGRCGRVRRGGGAVESFQADRARPDPLHPLARAGNELYFLAGRVLWRIVDDGRPVRVRGGIGDLVVDERGVVVTRFGLPFALQPDGRLRAVPDRPPCSEPRVNVFGGVLHPRTVHSDGELVVAWPGLEKPPCGVVLDRPSAAHDFIVAVPAPAPPSAVERVTIDGIYAVPTIGYGLLDRYNSTLFEPIYDGALPIELRGLSAELDAIAARFRAGFGPRARVTVVRAPTSIAKDLARVEVTVGAADLERLANQR